MTHRKIVRPNGSVESVGVQTDPLEGRFREYGRLMAETDELPPMTADAVRRSREYFEAELAKKVDEELAVIWGVTEGML